MAPDADPADKRMRLRYAGTCRLCAAPLAAGADAIYERESKTVRCAECPEASATASATASASVEIEVGVAGASARREHERRRARREDRIRADHPRIGGLILAVTEDPQSTRAWESGAVGEERLAQWLSALPDTIRVLHDRRIPRTKANIDHIVVSPAGVWVIDAKRYKDQRPSLQVEGGIIRRRTESLRVGGRDRTNLVRGVESQVARVAAALDDPSIPVGGVLCFLDADWPLIGGSFAVDGIDVVWPRRLLQMLTAAEPRAVDAAAVHARIAAAFPPA
ncbi:nuclease-related domain-containing protein [Microbacterium sp. zg-YB36]|uniref:nuclease-related domain-containing protein n=1 Tax=Microbacterium sp. zg-YB36 TaxID=2969407 RepID=UPI00214B7441|nr:nuclease-related domain-containing protein [Microbacterium sp. zg-YB36]MDL5350928.1 nuclease-related domain-containing protein [Microbacterium sp. zg-YB36]